MPFIKPEEYASDDDRGGFIQPPPDEYYVKIEEIEYKKSSSGSQYCNARLKVVGAKDEQYVGAIFWETFGLTEKSLFKICDASISCGNNNGWDTDYEGQTRKQLQGKVGKVKTKWEEYEGVRRTKVQLWMKTTPEQLARYKSSVSSSNDLPNGPSFDSDPRSNPGRDKIPF